MREEAQYYASLCGGSGGGGGAARGEAVQGAASPGSAAWAGITQRKSARAARRRLLLTLREWECGAYSHAFGALQALSRKRSNETLEMEMF